MLDVKDLIFCFFYCSEIKKKNEQKMCEKCDSTTKKWVFKVSFNYDTVWQTKNLRNLSASSGIFRLVERLRNLH